MYILNDRFSDASDVAIVYFSFKRNARQTARIALAAIFKQLLSKMPHSQPLPATVADATRHYQEAKIAPNTEVLLSLFIICAANFRVVWVVIDGVDRCDSPESQSNIDFILHRLERSKRCQVLVSMTDDYYLDYLDSRISETPFKDMKIEVSTEEIINYIDCELYRLTPSDKNISRSALEEIVKKSSTKKPSTPGSVN